jgi:hypothetical protein
MSGVGKGKEYVVAAEGSSYFNVTKYIADTPGLEPITADFELTSGIPLSVSVTDKANGKPLRGSVTYLARAENPHLKDYPRFGNEKLSPLPPSARSNSGTYTVLAIPGPGLLCVQADDADRYIGFELKDWDGFLLHAVPGGLHPSGYHAVIPIDVSAKDAKSTHLDFALEPGRKRMGTIVGPECQPLAGVHVAGLTPVPHWLSLDPRKRARCKGLVTANFTVLGLNPRTPRNIVFFHPEKKLGKVQAVCGDEAGPLTVHLEPLGGVSGRILDAKGRPWAEVTVRAELTRLITAYKDLPWELLEDLGPTMEVESKTEREGRFHVNGLLPGLRYNLAFSVGEIKPGAMIAAHRMDVTVEAGRTKDLGDIKSEQEADG